MALYCDLYHLTMCQTLLREGTHERHTVYEMFIRKTPPGYSYMVFAGLGTFLEWVDGWRGNVAEFVASLPSANPSSLSASSGTPPVSSGFSTLDAEFLKFLSSSVLDIEITALAEGEVFFPNTPLVQVSGSHWACVMVEAALLNFVNMQTAVATVASRIVGAAGGRDVVEFGLRRSMDTGGMMSSRAASIGGVTATSNVCAALQYSLPVVGTHAHSFVMSYGRGGEFDAFCSYMRHCGAGSATLLIDTYSTLQGASNAMAASTATGVDLAAVRIDSGDLAYLSTEVRKVLDAGGFSSTKIIVSSDLDEFIIASLIGEQDAPIDSFGVGTSLAVARGLSPLGGVYKLRSIDGEVVQKISADPFKTTLPGATTLVRMLSAGVFGDGEGCCKMIGDVILPMEMLPHVYTADTDTDTDTNTDTDCGATLGSVVGAGYLACEVRSVDEYTGLVRVFPVGTPCLVPRIRVGSHGAEHDYDYDYDRGVAAARSVLQRSLNMLDVSYRRLVNPHRYVVGIEESLFRLKNSR